MSVIAEQMKKVFDKERISRGQVAYAKYRTWEAGKCGLITSVTEEELIIQYTSSIGSSTNYFAIPVTEMVKGEWELYWSWDLATIMSEGS